MCASCICGFGDALVSDVEFVEFRLLSKVRGEFDEFVDESFFLPLVDRLDHFGVCWVSKVGCFLVKHRNEVDFRSDCVKQESEEFFAVE